MEFANGEESMRARGESQLGNRNAPARFDVSFLQGETMELDWSCGDLADGLRLYEAGEFFAAHESWELVWLRTSQPEKGFLQGLIQVTAAFHHVQRGNPKGTRLLLQAALMRLDSLPDNFGGICVAPLRDDIRSRLADLEANSFSIPPVAIRLIPS
jgi:predicted metal-dependent hydrolase